MIWWRGIHVQRSKTVPPPYPAPLRVALYDRALDVADAQADGATVSNGVRREKLCSTPTPSLAASRARPDHQIPTRGIVYSINYRTSRARRDPVGARGAAGKTMFNADPIVRRSTCPA